MSGNPYLPSMARIVEIKDEVPGARAIKTFLVAFENGGGFEHECGQCAMISVFGKGESMISIASAPRSRTTSSSRSCAWAASPPPCMT